MMIMMILIEVQRSDVDDDNADKPMNIKDMNEWGNYQLGCSRKPPSQSSILNEIITTRNGSTAQSNKRRQTRPAIKMSLLEIPQFQILFGTSVAIRQCQTGKQ